MQTFTLTFGDQAENHAGMQKIGNMANNGFTLLDLHNAEKWFLERGVDVEIINLTNYLPDNIKYEGDASVLVIRNGVDAILGKDKKYELKKEQDVLPKDSKAFMYGRVVNKKARHNLCFADYDQTADYENKKGTIISYTHVPLLSQLRSLLPTIIGEKGKDLCVEGNYYYDINKCGIGFHGDAERLRVIGVRLGATLPLHYQWFQNSKPVGNRCEIILNDGDMYIMSEKAVGTDWKKKKIVTLRHAAGCKKYLTIDK